ncbi:unnamed protein product [Dovyalis caffra]|uniref:C3H1-type domain-containing protein n=1 Tax=Dovyalis caffra TaxID=77055 RepID=A0AAV1RJK5_9ROSI|nr:unnamed protein product [Dovyalis caffra]
MEQQIEITIPIQAEIPRLGFQSPPSHTDSSVSSDLDQTAQDDHSHLHQELQNQLDLKKEFQNSNDSHEEEEEEDDDEEFKSEESDKKSENFDEKESSEKFGDVGEDLENKSEISNDNSNNNRRFHQFPVRPESEDCAYYMKTGTCKFGANCKFNHPFRRKNQGFGDKGGFWGLLKMAVKEKVKEREEATEKPGQTECKVIIVVH